MRKPLVFALVLVLVISALAAGPAMAAKGGNGGHTDPAPASLNCTYDSTNFSCHGSGFVAGTLVDVAVTYPDNTTKMYSIGIYRDGTIFFWLPLKGAGPYVLNAYQSLSPKQTLMATTSFTAP